MSVNSKQLQEFRPTIRYMDGENITLSAIGDTLAACAEKYGVPVAFREDEVSHGLFSQNTPCIVMYHPEHPFDYYNFCIPKSEQGRVALISVHTCGKSSQMGKEAIATRKTGAGAALLLGGSVGVGYAIGSGLTKAIGSIGRSKGKLENEKNWYGTMEGIFDEVIS